MSKPNNNHPNTPTPDHKENKTDQPKGQMGGGHGGSKATGLTPPKNNVIALPGMCLAEGCKKKSEKANFCMEHFDWFKEGLITKEGRKPTDFEKKFFDYNRRRKVA